MNEFYNKHYIRVENGKVIKGFSTAFETPLETDICINEKGGRHFAIDGEINPMLVDFENFTHFYRYDTELRKATEEELAAELAEIEANRPVVISEEDITLDLLADHEYRICMMELNQ